MNRTRAVLAVALLAFTPVLAGCGTDDPTADRVREQQEALAEQAAAASGQEWEVLGSAQYSCRGDILLIWQKVGKGGGLSSEPVQDCVQAMDALRNNEQVALRGEGLG